MLVSIGENTRSVSFSTLITDTEPLMQAVRVEFNDILQPGQEFFLQLKSEEWNGEFLDLMGSREIDDKTIVKAVVKHVLSSESSTSISMPSCDGILRGTCQKVRKLYA